MQRLERVGVGFSGANANRLLQRQHEDLAIADLAGLGGVGNGLHRLIDLVGRYRYLDLELGQEADGLFGAAVDLGVALLAAVSLDFRHGQPLQAELHQGVPDLIQFVGFDDGHHDFHGEFPLVVAEPKRTAKSRHLMPAAGPATVIVRDQINQTPCQYHANALISANPQRLQRVGARAGRAPVVKF